MNGTLDDGLPSDSSTRPYGSFIFIRKVLASTASKPATEAIIFWPIESRAAQRLIDAMQSSEVTGWPLLHTRPSRRVKVQVSLSADTSHLSTICGWTCELLVEREQHVPDEIAEAALDIGGGPDRIEDLQIRVHHRPDRLRAGGRCTEQPGDARRGHEQRDWLPEIDHGRPLHLPRAIFARFKPFCEQWLDRTPLTQESSCC